ncbi:MAG: hypothetical protein FJ387_26070 [Verrucomicrobia bacterium]|nr:hypothetical protein [Verrucomicrobiota bacterium]
MHRRGFLGRLGAGLVVAGLAARRRAAGGSGPMDLMGAADRKLVLVQFGGGTRYDDTVGDPEHRYIPRLWNELVPRGTLFTNLRVEGKVVHPNSTGSILTGHWEWADLDWSRPVAHPTLFEVYRRATGASDLKAWAFMYASILAQAVLSRAHGYGWPYAANVVVPPTIPRSTAEAMERWMSAAAVTGDPSAGAEAARRSAALARATSRTWEGGLRSEAARAFLRRYFAVWQAGAGTTSHDAFLTEGALACLREHAPDVLAVCYGEIDCAHYGSWSRYVEAIARTDALTGRLWDAVQSQAPYRGRTLFLVLPDHGRELESSGGLGFIHHSDFYTDAGADEGCRRVWMVAIGPGVPAGRIVSEAVPITAVAATGLEYLGLRASTGAAASVWPTLSDPS